MTTEVGRPVPGPLLLITASMGSGHTQVADELARRLSGRVRTRTVDLLEILPWHLGAALREGYGAALRRAPWLYEGVFRAFFAPRPYWQPNTSPLARLAAHRLRCVVADCAPCAVVSTFHLAGQAVGMLRQQDRLRVPSVVVITEPAAHVLWNHPATDLLVCPYPWVAEDSRRATGKPSLAPGPVIGPQFRMDGPGYGAEVGAAGRQRLRLGPGEHAVLISGGAWGMGALTHAVTQLSLVPSVRPVVLCGRNERLRRELDGTPGCLALGWREDLSVLFAGASVLVDNAGGTTCAEAFAAGLPVVGYDPLPGHGRAGMKALIRAGLVTDGHPSLPSAVAALCAPGPLRERQSRRAAEVFRADPAEVLAGWLTDHGVPLSPAAEG